MEALKFIGHIPVDGSAMTAVLPAAPVTTFA
jgi:hypothetical protein